MKSFLVTLFCAFVFSFAAQAQVYDVYDHSTPYPYIKLQPTPGVFLGQMMRNIGLKPNWSDRRWIRYIHEANPEQVDQAGEILYHTTDLNVPLAALRILEGYNGLVNQFQPHNPPPVQQPIQQVQQQPAPVEVVEPTETRPSDYQPNYENGFRLDVLLGGGTESFSIDDGVANRSELFSEANIFLKLDFMSLFSSDHQVGLSVQSQIKTYKAPASIGYNPDLEAIFEVRYHYGYRIFNGVFLNFVGQSKQFNVTTFQNTAIFLETYFGHSLGLGIDAPLADIGSKIISMYLDVQAIYADTLDNSSGTGIFSSLEIKVEPPSLEDGFILGSRLNYFDQKPDNYTDHSSYEVLAFLGYAF